MAFKTKTARIVGSSTRRRAIYPGCPSSRLFWTTLSRRRPQLSKKIKFRTLLRMHKLRARSAPCIERPKGARNARANRSVVWISRTMQHWLSSRRYHHGLIASRVCPNRTEWKTKIVRPVVDCQRVIQLR